METFRKCILAGGTKYSYIEYVFRGGAGNAAPGPDLQLFKGTGQVLRRKTGEARIIVDLPAAQRHGIVAEQLDKAVIAASTPGPYKRYDYFRLVFELTKSITVRMRTRNACDIRIDLRKAENRDLVSMCSFGR